MLTKHQSSEEYFQSYLKQDSGIPTERFAAFKIPSLVNGKRVPATSVKANVASDPRLQAEYKPS